MTNKKLIENKVRRIVREILSEQDEFENFQTYIKAAKSQLVGMTNKVRAQLINKNYSDSGYEKELLNGFNNHTPVNTVITKILIDFLKN